MGSFSSAAPHSLALISLHFIRQCGEPNTKKTCALVLSCARILSEQHSPPATTGLSGPLPPPPPSLLPSPTPLRCQRAAKARLNYAIWTPRTHHRATAKRTRLSHKRREGGKTKNKEKGRPQRSLFTKLSALHHTRITYAHTRTVLHG